MTYRKLLPSLTACVAASLLTGCAAAPLPPPARRCPTFDPSLLLPPPAPALTEAERKSLTAR